MSSNPHASAAIFRWAGVLYLLVFVFGIFSEVALRAPAIVSGDPEATARQHPCLQWHVLSQPCRRSDDGPERCRAGASAFRHFPPGVEYAGHGRCRLSPDPVSHSRAQPFEPVCRFGSGHAPAKALPALPLNRPMPWRCSSSNCTGPATISACSFSPSPAWCWVADRQIGFCSQGSRLHRCRVRRRLFSPAAPRCSSPWIGRK